VELSWQRRIGDNASEGSRGCKLPCPSLGQALHGPRVSGGPRRTRRLRPNGSAFSFQQMAAELSKRAACPSAARRGLRGIRIGEARHPGPREGCASEAEYAEPHLKILSCNVISWFARRDYILEEAARRQITVILVQESGVTTASIPTAAAHASGCGWEMVASPAPPARASRGGTLVLAREPFALLSAEIIAHAEGAGRLCNPSWCQC
jgi:hypothetical protein